MGFSQFKHLSDTLQAFEIVYEEGTVVTPRPFVASPFFLEDLAFVMREGIINNSEFAICETLIYPVLKEVWKSYSQDLLLWSHQLFSWDETLSGFPEYILARRSRLGKVVFDRPYLLVIEAKQDNFDWAWGQCLAAMVAAQRLNGSQEIIIFGVVSNGLVWQFGQLAQTRFTREMIPASIYALDGLLAALNGVFFACQQTLDQISERSPQSA